MRVFYQVLDQGIWITPLAETLEWSVDVLDAINAEVEARVRAVACISGRVIAANYVRRVDGKPIKDDLPLVV
jgi:hypothetical protein